MIEPTALASEIIELFGGRTNIASAACCLTRLRIVPKDQHLVKLDEIKRLNGVLGVQVVNNQIQIIIGPDVQKVYRALIDQTGLEKKMIFDKIDPDLSEKEETTKKEAEYTGKNKELIEELTELNSICSWLDYRHSLKMSQEAWKRSLSIWDRIKGKKTYADYLDQFEERVKTNSLKSTDGKRKLGIPDSFTSDDIDLMIESLKEEKIWSVADAVRIVKKDKQKKKREEQERKDSDWKKWHERDERRAAAPELCKHCSHFDGPEGVCTYNLSVKNNFCTAFDDRGY